MKKLKIILTAAIIAIFAAIIGGAAFANGNFAPLHQAAMVCDTAEAGRLIDGGTNVNAKTGFGSTALHLASLNGCAGMVMSLIDAKANVNAKNKNGETPIFFAVTGNQIDIGVALIKAGADLYIVSDNAKTPLGLAAAMYGRNSEMVKRLVFADTQKQ